MLKYQNIQAWRAANPRRGPRRGRRSQAGGMYSSWRATLKPQQDDRALTLFATDLPSQAESVHNLSWLLSTAQKIQAPIMVLKPNTIQLAGHVEQANLEELIGREWRDCWHDYWESLNGSWNTPEFVQYQWSSGRYVIQIHTWGSGYWCRDQESGIYESISDQKIKNRKEQIEFLWSHGFPSRRSRPVMVPSERYSGSVKELLELQQLAEHYRDRRYSSDVATKICAAFNSINRYCAWPGAW